MIFSIATGFDAVYLDLGQTGYKGTVPPWDSLPSDQPQDQGFPGHLSDQLVW